MQISLRNAALLFLALLLALFVVLSLGKKTPPEEYYCITSLDPLTLYEITPDEWDPRICINDGASGERSLVTITEEKNRLLEEEGARRTRE